MTLFFFQVFLTATNNGDDVFGESITNGPNGILNVDEFSIFGWDLPRSTSEGLFAVSYLYVALAFFVLVYVALHLLNDSRTGRAWRSLREDPLAAEVMGMPVNRLKLMAFAFGASVAALTGTFTTALNGSVFPQNFEFPLLITVYTMVILGGAGSQAGVVLGAVIVSVLLEALRDPGDARGLFYVVIAARARRGVPHLAQARRRARRHDRLRARRAARRRAGSTTPGRRARSRRAAGSRPGRPSG